MRWRLIRDLEMVKARAPKPDLFGKLPIWAVLVLVGTMSTGCRCSKGEPEIRVLTDRTASHLENLFKHYERERKVKIAVNFTGDNLLARLAARPKEADLVVTKNADLLEMAKQQGLLAPFQSQRVLGNVPVPFRDAKQYYCSVKLPMMGSAISIPP